MTRTFGQFADYAVARAIDGVDVPDPLLQAAFVPFPLEVVAQLVHLTHKRIEAPIQLPQEGVHGGVKRGEKKMDGR